MYQHRELHHSSVLPKIQDTFDHPSEEWGHTHIIPYSVAARDRSSTHQTFDKKRLWVVRGQGVHLPPGTERAHYCSASWDVGWVFYKRITHICVLRKGHLLRHSKKGGARLRIENVIHPFCLAVKVRSFADSYRRLSSPCAFYNVVPCSNSLCLSTEWVRVLGRKSIPVWEWEAHNVFPCLLKIKAAGACSLRWASIIKDLNE